MLATPNPQEAASSPEVLLGGLPWVDQVGLLIVLLFLVLGVWRGLWWQVIRLLGVLAAVMLARGLTPRFSPALEERFHELSPLLVGGALWLTLFLAGLVVASVFGMIGKRALETLQLGLIDRVGGGMAGALTGVVLHSALLVLLCTLPAREWSVETLRGSRSAQLLDAMTTKGRILVDARAAERFYGELFRDVGEGEGGSPAGDDGVR